MPSTARPGAGHDGRRLEFADDLFVRRHRGLGSPIVNQWTWRLDEPYDAARLRRVAEGLARGALSRQWHPALVPGARDRWSASTQPPVADLHAHVLPASAAWDWIDEQAAQPLDPVEGRTCRLAAVDLDDGTSVVTLLLCHAVGDGGAVFDAVVRAAADDPYVLPEVPAARWRRVAEDLADAGRQVAEVGAWARARLTRRHAPRHTGSEPVMERREGRPVELPTDWRPPRLVVELDTPAVVAAAERAGGSVNGLFATMLGRLVVAAGLVSPRSAVRVALPVDVREAGEVAANRTRIAMASLAAETLAARDLTIVKAQCKQAYADLSASGPGDVPVPLALVQMLPDSVVRRLPQPPQAVALASNLGRVPEAFSSAMGPAARSVAAMAHYQGVGAAENRSMGAGIGAWLVDTGSRTTVQVGAMAPDAIPTRDRLVRLVADEVAAWGLDAQWW